MLHVPSVPAYSPNGAPCSGPDGSWPWTGRTSTVRRDRHRGTVTRPSSARPTHRRVTLALALAAVLVAGSGTLASPFVRAAGPTALATPVPETISFQGRGFGHGVGMSQYGARGRSLDHQSAATILAHYYQGTTLARIDPATPIRVLVLSGFRASRTRPLVLVGLRSDWTMSGSSVVFPPDARVSVWPTTTVALDGVVSTTWQVRVTAPNSTVLLSSPTTGFRMRPVSGAGRLQVWSRTSSKDEYRGSLRIRLSSTARVINLIGLESYLRGVVPAEMPASWPTEALRAQTIAARSYAARHLRPGISDYDVRDDSTAQVYLGSEGERLTTNGAVKATSGVVLHSGGRVANALFHSTGGGATEDNENVFVSPTGAIVAGPLPYLRGSPDRRPDGTAYDAAAPWATWTTASYPRALLSAWFAADPRTDVGTLSGLDLSRRGVSGRLISVTLVGSLGSRTVSGAVFRSVFNAARPAGDPSMRSTLVDLRPVP